VFLSPKEVADYDRDGYVLVPNLFSEREVAALLHDVESGERVASTARGMADSSGKSAGIAIWGNLGDDIWAAASTNPRIVNNLRILLREEIGFFHGKVMLKEANSGGAWEWHQDYGYWYNQGFIFPRLISAFVALDPATRENGCLQVLRGSHLLGRLDHASVGQQVGAVTERLRKIETLFERVYCEMTPGSVLFFHCNLLHASAPNESDHPRRSFIMCYNALNNPELDEHKATDPQPVPVSSDDAILKFGE
jgi:ectoine hydroxylase-related dioxygenase (phytanoyl-CoA dioxygenase family)